MRMMLKWTTPVERGNAAIKDGSLTQTIETLMETLHPEAAYFWPEDGKRAGMIIFDMTDAGQIPLIVEPLFTNVDAAVEIKPVMNADDLRAALAKLSG